MSNTPGDKGARAARSEALGFMARKEKQKLLIAALKTHRRELEWLAGKCRAVGNKDGAGALLRDAIATSDLIEQVGS